MASYDKLVKSLIGKFESALMPLGTITKNQEIIIVQNKQLIDLLQRLCADREEASEKENAVEAVDTDSGTENLEETLEETLEEILEETLNSESSEG